VREALARVDPTAAAASNAAPPGPGPTESDIAAAAHLSPEQRATMVRGMVERLAARLQSDGADAEGWQRLIRAYMVLGEREKAKSALADARRAISGQPDKLRAIDELGRTLGLGDS
jgi:cytochrome c-type biogenesis protein CcmH